MAPVPDVFRSSFQTAPLDLNTDAFYPSRKLVIEKRLQVWGGVW
jgi:Fanconi-associated nuclease 1